jgi:hypothetical protein
MRVVLTRHRSAITCLVIWYALIIPFTMTLALLSVPVIIHYSSVSWWESMSWGQKWARLTSCKSGLALIFDPRDTQGRRTLRDAGHSGTPDTQGHSGTLRDTQGHSGTLRDTQGRRKGASPPLPFSKGAGGRNMRWQRLKSMNYGWNGRNIEIYVKFSGILCQKLVN